VSEEILFAMQNWNKEYDWWHPNNTPINFIYDGVKKLPFSHDFMYFEFENNLQPNGDESVFTHNAQKYEILHNYSNIKYCLLKNISERKYIYPIFVRTCNYFLDNEKYGFDFVDPTVINHVKNGQAKIVLIHPYEGFSSSPDWDILNSWCLKSGLSKNQVYFIHGNWNIPVDQLFHFTYIPIQGFVCSFPVQPPLQGFKPTNEKNLFLSYNRRSNLHRTLTVLELMHNKIFHRGLISYLAEFTGLGCSSTEDFITRHGMPDLVDYAAKLDSISPVLLDRDITAAAENPAWIVEPTHYSATFLSLITETIASASYRDTGGPYDQPVFFTEKTWKPISMKHPFMVVAVPGFLKELRNQGYKTFSAWWSEEYDNEPDLHKRILMLMQCLKELSDKSIEELQIMRDEIQPILDHNYQLYMLNRQQLKEQHLESSYREVLKIWNSF